MTYDELDKKIIEIKKKGYPYILQQSKISEVRGRYYTDELDKEVDRMTERVHENIMFLSKMHKSWPNANNVKEFVGIRVTTGYDKFINQRMKIVNFEYLIVVSIYYNIPVEILLFTDIQANEKSIKEQYPFVFGKNFNKTIVGK
jgi:hypothetical protein